MGNIKSTLAQRANQTVKPISICMFGTIILSCMWFLDMYIEHTRMGMIMMAKDLTIFIFEFSSTGNCTCILIF